MSMQHVPVHHTESMEEILEDPFDDELESTFPPQRYCATFYPRPQQGGTKLRRESSIERSRLYRELVGHEPYRPPAPRVQKNAKNDFRVMLSVKHYTPEEITLKVDGQKLYVSGKHHQELESGYDKSEFQRVYNIPEQIDMHTLTSTITLDGVLIIRAIVKHADPTIIKNTEEFGVLPADDDGDKFKVTLNVSEYKPSEISIHVNDRYLVVTAERKEERVDEHGAIEHHKRYERKFSLTAEVDSEFLSSRYRDGKITIEAPRKEVSNEMRKLEIKEEKD